MAEIFPLVLGRSTDEKETCEGSEMETKTTSMVFLKTFLFAGALMSSKRSWDEIPL